MENIFTKRREPFAFMLYLGIFGSALLFFFIFLIFLKKETVNQEIPLFIPKVFWISTFAILVSSVILYYAKVFLENQNFVMYRILLSTCFCLGLGFLALQFLGWKSLFDRGMSIDKHTGASFLYILSALHIVHTLGGLVALGLTLSKAFRSTSYVDSFVYSVNPPNLLNLKLVSMYWHFLDVLWVIIFIFLLYHAT
jgi:cytochrome c oxidase subunit III